MELQKQNNNLLVNTLLIKQVANVNLLVQYPLSDSMIELWAKSIEELAPKLNPLTLKVIIDRFKVGRLEWDSKLGIQNIFLGYVNWLQDIQKDLQKKKLDISEYGIPKNECKDEFIELQKQLTEISKEIFSYKKPSTNLDVYGVL